MSDERCSHGRMLIDPCIFCSNEQHMAARAKRLQAAEEECVYCSPHLTSQHHDGCTVPGCPCGFDGDWHIGEPDRPDPWHAS